MPSSTALIGLARQHLTAGDVEYASRCCRAVLDHKPAHITAHLLLAECLAGVKEYGQVKDLLLRVISSVPDELSALRTLGFAMAETDGLSASEYVFQIAYDNHPDHPKLASQIVGLLGRQLSPSEVGLARLRLYAGQFDDATRMLSGVLSTGQQRLDARALLALAYHRSGDRPYCEVVCKDLLLDSPDCLPALAIMLQYEIHDDPYSTEVKRLASQIADRDPAYQYVREILPPDASRNRLPSADVEIDLPSDVPNGAQESAKSPTGDVRDPDARETDDWMSQMIRAGNAGESDSDLSLTGTDMSRLPSPDRPHLPPEVSQAGVSSHVRREDQPANQLYESSRLDIPSVDGRTDQRDSGLEVSTKSSGELVVAARRAIRRRMNEAVRSQQSNRFDEAVSEYAAILRSEPSVAGEVVENVRWIVYAKPNHLAALKTLGDAYMRLGDTENAVQQYSKVMSRRKSNGCE